MTLKGTKFQIKVWKYLKTIPKGKVKSYKEVAIGINRPKSARAVANACAMNPYAPQVPCHRVIKSDGTLEQFLIGITRDTEIMMGSDKILTIAEPAPTILEKYLDLIKE